jgi:hypothetical protein
MLEVLQERSLDYARAWHAESTFSLVALSSDGHYRLSSDLGNEALLRLGDPLSVVEFARLRARCGRARGTAAPPPPRGAAPPPSRGAPAPPPPRGIVGVANPLPGNGAAPTETSTWAGQLWLTRKLRSVADGGVLVQEVCVRCLLFGGQPRLADCQSHGMPHLPEALSHEVFSPSVLGFWASADLTVPPPLTLRADLRAWAAAGVARLAGGPQ